MAARSKKPVRTPPGLSIEDEGMMTMAAVAELLATTPRQVRNMAGRGQFVKPLKVPGLGTRFRTAMVKAWLASTGGGEAVPA